MIRFPRCRRRADDERILPLINVVFLLLIFFMLAGRPTAFDPLEVEPPRSASDGTTGVREPVVSIAADGRLALDGTVIEDAALAAALADRVSHAASGRRVRLEADGGAEATQVVRVMEVVRDSGAETLELVTVPVP